MGALLWSAFFAALQWSVVRFELLIVGVLVMAAAALALWQWGRPAARPFTAESISLALVLSALTVAAVPTFSYLPAGAQRWALGILAAGALICAIALRRPGRGPVIASLAAPAAYLIAASIAIVSDRAPRIDVWVILQQASDGMLQGKDIYSMTWTGSPGIKDAFTYLPWTGLLLAPGRWLFGDVRWALLFWTMVAVAGLWRLARAGSTLNRGNGRVPWAGQPAHGQPAHGQVAQGQVAQGQPGDPVVRRTGEGVRGSTDEPADEPASERPWPLALCAVPLLLLAPGTLTQIDQAWTEPLLLAGLVWWAALVCPGRPRATWWAVVPLALACASKQHLVLLLPILMVWRPFGLRRTLATGVLAGLLVLPWFVAGPADFLHDTVLLLVSFHPIRFANTLYLLALNRYGVTLPFWLTGLVVLAALVAVGWTVWRRQPQMAELLRWLALVLLVANLVNKQAFYNQFWLSGALLAASLAATGRRGVDRPAPDLETDGTVSSPPGTRPTARAGPARVWRPQR